MKATDLVRKLDALIVVGGDDLEVYINWQSCGGQYSCDPTLAVLAEVSLEDGAIHLSDEY